MGMNVGRLGEGVTIMKIQLAEFSNDNILSRSHHKVSNPSVLILSWQTLQQHHEES